MSLFRSIASLRGRYGVGILVSWVLFFLVVVALQSDCPPKDRYCHPLFKPIVGGAFALNALFFLTVVWSETARRIVIRPRRRDEFDEHAFYAVGLFSLLFVVLVFFFV
jgi:hypothetical protein